MPCRCDDYDTVDNSAQIKQQQDRQETDRMRKDLDHLTKMLCRSCELMEENKNPVWCSDALVWWKDHKKKDLARLDKEIKAKQKALQEAGERADFVKNELEELRKEQSKIKGRK